MRYIILVHVLSISFFGTALAKETSNKCNIPETIYIEVDQEYKFTEDFIINSLQATIDPNGPNTHKGVAWGSANGGNWFSIDDFKGPFFIKAGEKLLPRKPENTRAIVVSGYRCRR